MEWVYRQVIHFIYTRYDSLSYPSVDTLSVFPVVCVILLLQCAGEIDMEQRSNDDSNHIEDAEDNGTDDDDDDDDEEASPLCCALFRWTEDIVYWAATSICWINIYIHLLFICVCM